MPIIFQLTTQCQPKGPVGRSLREVKQGDHSRLKFTKEDGIPVYKGGETCGFMGCKHAFHQLNACRLALCHECCDQLKGEHGVKSFDTGRHYKFAGCINHSYKDLTEYRDGEGAHWCTEDMKENSEDDPRPHGCVHCLHPFIFCGPLGRKRSKRK